MPVAVTPVMSSFVYDDPRHKGDTMSQLRVGEALHALATRLGTNPLTGQTAVIVGASRGLGLELARQLAQAGCKLALCADDAMELEQARRELVTLGAAVFAQPLDATQPEQVEAFVNATLRRFGSLDMLITSALPCSAESTSRDALEQIFWTAYHPTLAVLPHMRLRRAGRIVHVRAREVEPGQTPHCTAHSALSGFSESLRCDVARDGISVTTALTSQEGERAARRILHAATHGKPEITLGTRIRALTDAFMRTLLAQPAREAAAHSMARLLRTSEAFRRSPGDTYRACPLPPRTSLTTDTTSILRVS